MNFLTLGAKSLKKAQKAARQQAESIEKAKHMGLDTSSMKTPDEVMNIALEDDFLFMEKAMDVGLRFYEMATTKLGRATDNLTRTYMLTVRPPSCNFATFKNSCDEFIGKWSKKWIWAEWAYEQKGTCIEDAGKGFHIHIVFCTNTPNYFPSHILRDAYKSWPYVAPQCIQIDTLKDVERARYYIRGDKKNEAKEEACVIDVLWRLNMGLPHLGGAGSSPNPLPIDMH